MPILTSVTLAAMLALPVFGSTVPAPSNDGVQVAEAEAERKPAEEAKADKADGDKKDVKSRDKKRDDKKKADDDASGEPAPAPVGDTSSSEKAVGGDRGEF